MFPPASSPARPPKTTARIATDLQPITVDFVDLAAPAFLTELQDAVRTHEQVEIEYWSAGRDASTTRIIDPVLVHALQALSLVVSTQYS